MWLHALLLELVLLLAAWIALGVWQRDRVTPGRRTFFGLNLAVAVWFWGDLELRAGRTAGGRQNPDAGSSRCPHSGWRGPRGWRDRTTRGALVPGRADRSASRIYSLPGGRLSSLSLVRVDAHDAGPLCG